MKINYGIYIGTSSASIAKMEAGEPVVIRSNSLKDSIPMAVFINRRGAIHVGDAAMNALKAEKLNALKNWEFGNDNAFIEFTRTLGSDAKYHSSNADRSFSSEELLAEVLKTLISFEKDFDVEAAVITIPAAFKYNQIEAVRKAGYLAGLKQIEILQEPVAAAMAYGLNSKNKDGYWLIFDLGVGAFDAALLKVSDGIIQIIDTEGNQFYGSSLIDEAIVNEIIIPHLQENFKIQELLADNYKSKILRNSMKFYAEEIKEQLLLSDETSILTNLGDIPVEDDGANELELDMTVTASELEKAIAPVFQKAIDISLDLLKRNNLKGSDLNSLILAGKPTYSLILRGMLSEQICEPDTSIDPEAIIVKGAAIYASTIDLKVELENSKRDRTNIQLEIGHEASTVETEEFVTVKILEDKTEREIPEKVFAEIKRDDNAWSSGKVEINTIGEVIDVQLNEGKTNIFGVTLHDGKGNILESEPNIFSILHLEEWQVTRATLPYNIGIEVEGKNTGKLLFRTIKGLEKSKALPASGTLSNLKTPKAIRPGVDSDFYQLGIYQGENGAEGTRAIYNHHINTIVITGNDLPALLPENSNIDIEIRVDINQRIVASVHIPCLDFTIECECESAIDASGEDQANYLNKEIIKGFELINQLKAKGVVDYELDKAEKELAEIKSQFDIDKLASDNQQQVLEKLRKVLKVIDEFESKNEWPKLELDLKEAHNRLDSLSNDLKNDNIIQMAFQFKTQLNEVIKTKDIKVGNFLLQEVIKETNRIESINEKYDREYLKLYENGEMTLFEVKQSLEEVKRQKGRVYQQVLDLIEQENKNITKAKVEDLLFQLTEDGLIPANTFQEFYERLSLSNVSKKELSVIFKQIDFYNPK
ncbi:MAG: Hsp70 family protein [Cryomorphaceae bacterium]|nr:Hsp70 family protein [Cryomorphaceae bacterium]